MNIDWIPAGISSGALAAFFVALRQMNAKLQKDREQDKADIISKICENREAAQAMISRLDHRLTQDEKDYMTEEKHDNVCTIKELKVNAHLTSEMRQLKDEVFGELRQIKGMIKNGNGNGKK